MGPLFTPLIPLLLFSMFFISSSSDMSIITYDDSELKTIYETWIATHGKSYNALGEKEQRFQIFKDNLNFIEQHNAMNRAFTVGLNRFADLTNAEYRSMYLGAKKRKSVKLGSDRYAPRVGDDLPGSVDWRKKGAVVEVKDQGSCG